MMKKISNGPRVLIVTPEVTYLPDGMGNHSNCRNAKAGGLADVSAVLVSALYEQGADVHVAIPDYRRIFNGHMPALMKRELGLIRKILPESRVHLAQDRAFFYLNHVYSTFPHENIRISLAFQREVINHIVPKVAPDLIHCNDWMTGLIPAMARQLNIPCLFSIHNIHTVSALLSEIEDRGIDAASFWQNLYFAQYPSSYEGARNAIPVDFLTSGVFAAHFVNTVSPTFLDEIIEGRHDFIAPGIRQELANKKDADCATGILNAPDPSFNPKHDKNLFLNYTPEDHVVGKKANKQYLQKSLGLLQDADAPVFFWPSRLDPVQKGCQLLAEVLYTVVSRYWERRLQLVFVANGPFQEHFRNIVKFHHLSDRVGVCGFNERLSRLAFAASDFVLMPSRFEPCGLPQMIGAIYGALPICHDTGGLHDTVTHLDIERDRGNGFLFKTHDSTGLFWAIEEAMRFYRLPVKEKKRQLKRIMDESASRFNYEATARHYIEVYEKMLKRPLVGSVKSNIISMNHSAVNGKIADEPSRLWPSVHYA